jgi:hypothetical protein
MRSKVRLILSSYVVVLAACSSAPAPVIAPVPGSSSGGVRQQGRPVGAPALAPAPAPARRMKFARARAGSGDTLSVRVYGPAAVKLAGDVPFSAAIHNGGMRRYYYWWFVASCAQGAGCTPSSYRLLAEGEERTTVDVPFGPMNAEKDIVVQVVEIDGDGQTGSSAQLAVAGPAPRPAQRREGVSGGICDWFAGSFYPHVGTYTDPKSNRTWTRRFRRDYCGNRISWAPES